MLRAIGSVIVGYIAIVAVMFVSFTAIYLAIGADRAFQPGTYEVSAVWAIISIVVGLIAAAVGGMVCAAIARRPGPPKVFAAIVLVFGLLMAIPAFTMQRPEVPPRTGDVPNLEAMQHAQTPAWLALLNPFIGAAGILVGASLVRTDRRATSPPTPPPASPPAPGPQ